MPKIKFLHIIEPISLDDVDRQIGRAVRAGNIERARRLMREAFDLADDELWDDDV